MALQYSPKIVQDGLVMCLDPSQNKSYPTTDLPVKNGLVMWMDAADDTTFSYSSGTTVSQWRDKSGFNYHMVPVSAGPTRNAFLNSRKVIACTTSQQIWNSAINLVTSPYTIFGVTRLTGTTNARVLTTQYVPSTGGNWLLGHWAGYVNQYYAEGWVSGPYGTSANTAWNIFMGDWSGSSTDLANLYTNGTAITTNSNGASAGPIGLGININSETSTCEAAEIVVFNRVLSTAERRLVDTYLGQKWGISNTDRSIIDLSGNDDNGLFGNGTVANMPDYDFYNKGALTFNGTSDYINLGNASSIRMGTGNFTISTWIKILTQTGTPTYKLIITSKNAAAAAAGYGFAWNNSVNKFLWSTANGSSSSEIFTTNTWSSLEGIWANVVMIRQNGATNNGHFYINGVYESLASAATVLNVDTATNMTVANTADLYSDYWFKGLYGSVLIYNRALSAAEVAQNYQAQKSKFANTIVQQGLVLNLDAGNPYSYAGAGTTWYDVSGNGKIGTLTGGVTYSSIYGGDFILDGVNGYVQTDLNQNTDNAQITWEAWFWDNSPGGFLDNTAIISNYGPNATTPFTILHMISDGRPYFVQRNSSATEEAVYGSTSICNSIWHHVVGVVDNSNMLIYVDGVLQQTKTKITGTTTSGQNLVIGGNHLGRYQSCRIASARCYNIALSAAQVLQNYNATKGRFGL